MLAEVAAVEGLEGFAVVRGDAGARGRGEGERRGEKR